MKFLMWLMVPRVARNGDFFPVALSACFHYKFIVVNYEHAVTGALLSVSYHYTKSFSAFRALNAIINDLVLFNENPCFAVLSGNEYSRNI